MNGADAQRTWLARASVAAAAVSALALAGVALRELVVGGGASAGAWLPALLASVVGLAGLRGLSERTRELERANARLQQELAEKARAQQTALGSRRRLQLLLDHLPDGVVAYGGDGRIEWINPEARLMFQLGTGDAVGRPLAELIPSFDQDRGAAAGAGPGAPRRELQGRRADGTRFALEVARVDLDPDAAQGGMCVLRDLSQAQRIEHMKHEFVSMVSHELRTPLTSLRGALALLVDGSAGALPRDAQRLFTMARDNAERLVTLVNDILDFEKLRAGGLRIDFERTDLLELTYEALAAIEGMATQARVELRLAPRAGSFPVHADPGRLLQVLGNLLSNAIKFTPSGGRVDVTLSNRGERVRLVVRDGGPGVPADFVARLFEPFQQARDPRHRKQGGSGLGLAISRGLMDAMHGSIGLEPPRPGDGARFWIELPVGGPPPSTFGELDE